MLVKILFSFQKRHVGGKSNLKRSQTNRDEDFCSSELVFELGDRTAEDTCTSKHFECQTQSFEKIRLFMHVSHCALCSVKLVGPAPYSCNL